MALANFQRISFDEANPGLVGAQRAMQLMQMPAEMQQKILANKLAQIQLQYAPSANQQRLLALKLANQANEQKLPYVGQQANADLQSTLSNTNKTNTMLPLEAENQKNINKWYGPKSEQEINSGKSLADFRKMGGGRLGTGAAEEIFLQNLVSKDNPQLDTPEKIYEARNVYANGGTQLSDGTPLNPISPATRSAMDRIVKGTNTAQGLNQQRFAATTDKLLEEGQKLMPVVSQYSGALGKGSGGIDAVKNALGVDTPAYNDYVYFTRTVVPTSAGEMMRAFGVNASDEQKKLYISVVNPFAWDQNPKAAMENYNKMTKLFRDVVSKQVAKPISQLREELNNPGKYSNSNATVKNLPQQYSQQEIDAEIKRRGLTGR